MNNSNLLLQGARWTVLATLSTKTRMLSRFLEEIGRYVTNSMETSLHLFSGIWVGCNLPLLKVWLDFFNLTHSPVFQKLSDISTHSFPIRRPPYFTYCPLAARMCTVGCRVHFLHDLVLCLFTAREYYSQKSIPVSCLSEHINRVLLENFNTN